MEAKNKIIQHSLIGWAFFLSLFISASAIAATHYVSPNGSASWASSTNIKTPCSLSTANSNADDDDVVYLRAGTYSTQLNPSNSGSSGHPITFAAYTGEDVYFSGNNPAINLTAGQDYFVLDGFKTNTLWQVLRATNSTHVELKNCHFSAYMNLGRWFYTWLETGCQYWNIHNNTFDVALRYSAGEETGSLLGLDTGSSYNYIHDNTFINGLQHDFVSLTWSQHNIIKNNTFYNTGTWTGQSNGPNEMLMLISNSSYNVIDGNIFYETGSNFGDGALLGISVHKGDYNIVRRNIGYHLDNRCIGFFTNQTGSGGDSEYNRIYNNTCYDTTANEGSYLGAISLQEYDANGSEVKYNVVKNNILSRSSTHAISLYEDVSGKVHDNIFDGNWIYNKSNSDVYRFGSTMSIGSVQSSYPAQFMNNSPNDLTDPKLTNPDNGDMTLQSDSQCIDAGQWLATITSATGSGISFSVDDANYFMDGYGIINGDVIKTQDGQTATIISINYSTGRITVDKSIGWTHGEGIALYYEGARPDIGAKEYSSDNKSISPPHALTIIAN